MNTKHNANSAAKCGKCHRTFQVSGLIDVPCKVIIKPGLVIESDGRKSIDNVYTIARRVLCYFCYTTSQQQESDQMKVYGTVVVS